MSVMSQLCECSDAISEKACPSRHRLLTMCDATPLPRALYDYAFHAAQTNSFNCPSLIEVLIQVLSALLCCMRPLRSKAQ